MRRRRVHVGYAILRLLSIVPRATCERLSEDIEVHVYTIRYHVRELLQARLIDKAGYVPSGSGHGRAQTYRLHPDLRTTLP